METQIMNQDLGALNSLVKYKFLKKAFQFLLSLSIFSLFISLYSSWSSLLVHSFNLYVSSSPFHFSIDRKYLFLLCNGIIVFLSTNCGTVGPSKLKTQDKSTEIEFPVMKYVVQNEAEVQRIIQESEKCEDGKQDVVLITNGEKEKEEENSSLITYEEVEGANGMLSTEELNRKCDEFIRKIKEELRTGAQQKLVIV